MKFTSLNEAEQYLDSFIPKTSKWGEPSFAHGRTRQLMRLLGDPQNNLSVIHIAGTSGKGSTAYITSSLLHSHGLKTGLSISPHVHDLLERIQIDGKSISENQFCHYLEEIVPFIEKMKDTEYGAPTYFEITMALAYYVFYHEKVDVAVMETGLGGRYDASNTIDSEDKIAVITRIGYDHMEFLGNTLSSIANEKAHIIQPKNDVVTLDQDPEAMSVIEQYADEQHARLHIINTNKDISRVSLSDTGITFEFSHGEIHYKDIEVSLLGLYQSENAALALTAFNLWMKRNKRKIDEQKVRESLKNVKIPGRMEMKLFDGKSLILDGAHNVQKMTAFIDSLRKLYQDMQFDFLIAFKKGKEYDKILPILTPIAHHIYITQFENIGHGQTLYAEDPKDIAKVLNSLSFKNYSIIPSKSKAFEKALENKENTLVVTGSFYLIGEIYNLIGETDHTSC